MKVAFRAIRDCCSMCTKDTLLCLRFVAQTRGIEEILVRVLVTSHESSTDNDSVNGERESAILPLK